jgi:hypothetical protein
MNNKPNFNEMTRDELAHYIVAHRDTPEGMEARRVFISQMAKRFESRGIDFYRRNQQSPPIDSSTQSN